MNEKPDISLIREDIKNKIQEPNGIQYENEKRKKPAKNTSLPMDNDNFGQFINRCRGHVSNNVSPTTIDTEAMELLKLIKSKTGVSITDIISTLCGDFLIRYSKEIKALHIKNKYLK